MNRFVRYILLFVFLITLPFAAYFAINASSDTLINTSQEKVIYNLPYPGLLPDSPLYFFKIVRDKVTELLTRDNVKKAQLYLLYSDKRAVMSIDLAQKGKNQLAIDTFSKGEKYSLAIPDLLIEAKKQGDQIPSGFVETLKQSNAMHKELIDELIKVLPQGLNEPLNQLTELNQKILTKIGSLP